MTVHVVPKVNSCQIGIKQFVITPETPIVVHPEAPYAGQLLESLTKLAVTTDENIPAIRLMIIESMTHSEGYRLRINEKGVTIESKTDKGLFYGVQTFRQLMPVEVERYGIQSAITIPYMIIEDAPRFNHRGFMMDEARHFFGIDEVKRYIDLLALLKINTFHWHLTDHQGWRIEIKRYPKLTEIGSKRMRSQKNKMFSMKPDYIENEVTGYYTQDQIREIVQYAKERFIEVIPEIDIPGHFYAALAAYPELSCDGKPVEVGTDFGLSSFRKMNRLLCAGKDSSYEFFKNVLDEIVPLFPSNKIHLGSDEAQKGIWKKCPDCKKTMETNNLKNVHELQGYMVNVFTKHLQQKGVEVICWNDGLSHNADPSIIVQHWIGNPKKIVEEIKKGRRVIVSSLLPYYLDYTYEASTLKQSYEFEPIYKGITEEQSKQILGIESPIWTEFVRDRKRLDWQVFPRLIAVSESAWTQKKYKNYIDFENRIQTLEQRLSYLGVYFTPREWIQKFKKSRNLLFLLFGKNHPANRHYEQYHRLDNEQNIKE